MTISKAEKPCRNCDGLGHVACKNCKGTGKLNEGIGRDGKYDCAYCNGGGRQECLYCKGTGIQQ
jgi:hypothetical protein